MRRKVIEAVHALINEEFAKQTKVLSTRVASKVRELKGKEGTILALRGKLESVEDALALERRVSHRAIENSLDVHNMYCSDTSHTTDFFTALACIKAQLVNMNSCICKMKKEQT
jgi:hypothetical protein